MTKKRVLNLLVFLTITFIISFIVDNDVTMILSLTLILITSLTLYNMNQELKVVIHKRQLKSKRYNKKLSDYYVMFVELSNLNTYSQFYDIEIGDALLKQVYKTLKKHVPKRHLFLYRTDQIVIIQEFKNTHVINSKLRYDEQYRNASKLLHYLKRQNFTVHENDNYEINIKIGVSSQGPQKRENTLNDLIRLAHFAMIKSKEKNYDIVVANDEMRTIKQDLDSFNQEIDHGFKLDEFSPFFLPIIDMKTFKIAGVESLVRWRKDKYRVIEAGKFKDIALEKQLFEKIDMRVIEKTFQSYQSWKENNIVSKDFKITINLSTRSLINANPVKLTRLAQSHGVDPQNIEFDISDESAISEEGKEAISRLQELGFGVSLDTFNSRCFSIKSLLDINIDTIKIDKSNLPNTELTLKEKKFYKTIVRFSKAFDLKVLSKGIENKHHLNIAKQLNVDYAQGYYFTPPLDDEKIVIYLNKYKDGILTH